uniref:LRRCT domain-containing protein n=1 Tax=Branchiostoma floridae TaxID=7739 RepID=C3ZYS6_BRAFL|eukprot:XP_002586300.1 hypothetical protein BRAFLDRAFT_82906 [Branchiostoma floridae]
MGRNMRHLLMFLLIILKEPNMPEADCSCPPTPPLRRLHLTSIPQNLLTSTCWLFLSHNQIKIIQPGAFSNLPQLQLLDLTSNQITLIKPAGLALVGTVILTIWCKRRTNNSPSDPSSGPNIALSNLNMTGTVVINGHYYRTEQDHDHQYEDIDQHNQTRQGQSKAITQSNKNITATVMTSGLDQQYEDMAPQHNQTGQGQSQATTESNPNTTASVGSSDHGQSTAQGHPQAITEFKNPSYGTGHIASMQSALYKVVGQSQAITEPNPNTTASVEASDDGQSTVQGHRQAIIELKIPSYGTGQIVSMQSPLYKVVGPSHAITESNTNTTAAVIPSVLDQQYENMAPQHNQTGQGQSHAITESNPNTTATVMTSGLDQQYEDMAPQHNQTGQGQSQAINESNPNTTATVMTSGYDHWY